MSANWLVLILKQETYYRKNVEVMPRFTQTLNNNFVGINRTDGDISLVVFIKRRGNQTVRVSPSSLNVPARSGTAINNYSATAGLGGSDRTRQTNRERARAAAMGGIVTSQLAAPDTGRDGQQRHTE